MERYNITLTRFTLGDGSQAQKLGYLKWGSDWRLVVRDESGDAVTGPIYRTKAELLGDLARYAERYGFEGDAPVSADRLTLTADCIEKITKALERAIEANDWIAETQGGRCDEETEADYTLLREALAILKPEVLSG